MRRALVLIVLLCAVEVRADEQKPARPTAEDLAAVRDRIDQARQAAAAAGSLPPASRDLLRSRIDAAAAALSRYEQLTTKAGPSRVTGLLFMAGAGLVADDVSGVGVADDALLPLVALALIADRLLRRPIDDLRLGRAWNDVLASSRRWERRRAR